MKATILLARLTFTEFFRQRWVLGFSFLFAALVLLLSLSGGGVMGGIAGFDKVAATLLNILLFFIPLFGFVLGAQMISTDRDSDALDYLLSHPIKKTNYFLGKLYGSSLVIFVSLSIGFGLSGIGMAFNGLTGVGNYLTLWFLSLLFAFLCVSIGLLISVVSVNRTKALGLAILIWLVFTIFSDLGIMGASLLLKLGTETTVGLVLLNPMETFKVIVVKVIGRNLEVLGSGGLFFDVYFGDWMAPLLLIWLLFVLIATVLCGLWIFLNQEEV